MLNTNIPRKMCGIYVEMTSLFLNQHVLEIHFWQIQLMRVSILILIKERLLSLLRKEEKNILQFPTKKASATTEQHTNDITNDILWNHFYQIKVRIHWSFLTILKINKKAYEVIQYSIHYIKLKHKCYHNFLRAKKMKKNPLFFLSRASTH